MICLWGWRRGDLGYVFVPGEQLVNERLEAVGIHDFARDMYTVLR